MHTNRIKQIEEEISLTKEDIVKVDKQWDFFKVKEEDFDKIGMWLKGSESYALQEFRNEGKVLDEKFGEKIRNKPGLNLKKIKKNLENKKYFKQIIIK